MKQYHYNGRCRKGKNNTLRYKPISPEVMVFGNKPTVYCSLTKWINRFYRGSSSIRRTNASTSTGLGGITKELNRPNLSCEMRRLVLIALIIVGAFNVRAQKQKPEGIAFNNAPITVASEKVKKMFIAPETDLLKSGVVSKSNFQVEFVNFPEEAKSAFLYAVSIYEQLLESPVTIHVTAKWESKGTNVLAASAPTYFYKNFTGSRFSNVYYPVALAEKLAGREINGTEADVECSFNKNISWYLGVDGNVPTTQYDFVTVVLHELIHGLGFSGFFDVVNGQGTLNNASHLPSVYDYMIYNTANQQLANSSKFPVPSSQLKSQFESGQLLIANASKVKIENIYAPSNWNSGTSIYHFNEAGFQDGDADELMSPFVHRGEAIHYPGKKTLEVLYEMGWKTVTFEGEQIKDFEVAIDKLPTWVTVGGDLNVDPSSVKAVFSTDRFATSTEVSLTFNSATGRYEGEMPLNKATGKIYYYYSAKTKAGNVYTLPSQAPTKSFSFLVGPDFYPPKLTHNPVKLVLTSDPKMYLEAVATDNVGVKTVKVYYRINGQDQEPVELTSKGNDLYAGTLQLPGYLNDNDVVEYRLCAIDNTARGNKRYYPTTEYVQVNVSGLAQPLEAYKNNFDQPTNDFELADFQVSVPSGFKSGVLHSLNPYPVSNVANSKLNLIAQLKYPIVVRENGQMRFDEVVLVEPGEEGTTYVQDNFWDYVIVEGSKDNGKTWLPLGEGYDAGADGLWYSRFANALKSSGSEATADENILLPHTINLETDTPFEPGDTILIRFRLASDQDVTGWGWAIDNLVIQETTTAVDDAIAENNISVYPNPFQNTLFIEGVPVDGRNPVDVIISDMFGKVVHRETRNVQGWEKSIRIDLPALAPGMYLATVTDNEKVNITQKLIKN